MADPVLIGYYVGTSVSVDALVHVSTLDVCRSTKVLNKDKNHTLWK